MKNVLAYAVLLVFVAITETLLVSRNEELARGYRAVVLERDALRGALIVVNMQVTDCRMDIQELRAQLKHALGDTTPNAPPVLMPPVTPTAQPRPVPVFPRESQFSGVR